jgi:hypothetical protein
MTALDETGQQSGVKYILTDSQGFSVSFNDETDPNFVGYFAGEDAITGLDSPEVRSNTADLVQDDGGVFAGYSFHGQRPITLQGNIKHSSTTDRNAKMTQLQRVVNNLMRASGTLTWTPDGGASQFVTVRKQQPLRIKGGWVKAFFIRLIAPDPVIYSTTQMATPLPVNTNTAIANAGNADVYPDSIRINGPSVAAATATGPMLRLYNQAGVVVATLYLPGLIVPNGGYIDLDFKNKTIVDHLGANKYSYFDWSTSTWFKIPQAYGSGTNWYVRVSWDSGTTTGATGTVNWRSGWL